MIVDGATIARQIPAAVMAVCRRLADGGFAVHLVGGAIRDLHLGRPAKDFDVATAAHPRDVVQLFGRKRTIPTGEKHGTVTVLVEIEGERHGVEVTTFRGEGAYSDGRRPDHVEFVGDLVEDLRRRDFTINAIAFDPLRQLVEDPFDGRVDLDRGLIRAVGDAHERFNEDGLRVMRAVRFAAQLGFRLEEPTEAAIPGALPVLRRVSAERIRDELLKLLGSPRPSLGLELMRRTGVLGVVIPELVAAVGHPQNRFHSLDVWAHTVLSVDETPGDAVLRLATLLHDVAKPRTAAPRPDSPGEFTFFRHDQVGAAMSDGICRRLRLSNRDRERVVALVGHHMFWYSPEWTDATVRRFIGRVGLELLGDLFALREGDVRGRGRGEDPAVELAELKQRVEGELTRASALKVTDLAIGGGDVMRLLGCAPGRIVGDVLKQLLERVIEEPALNTREQLEAMVPALALAVARAGEAR